MEKTNKTPLKNPDVWNRRFYLLLTGVFLWRLLFIYIAPLDLVPDEAYYWDWSRRLAWGYYSKPPLIAWINALSSRLMGSTFFSVRLPAVILGIMVTWMIFTLARRMYNSRVAFWSAFALLASTGSCASGFIMTIDAPLLCFWSLSLYTLWMALNEKKNEGLWWILTGLSVGLGLLSKQMMIAFLIITPLFLWLSPDDRHLLKRAWPYLLIILSLCALIPVVWWNSQHQWITLQHTAHHFAGNSKEPFAFLKTFFDFIGSQLLVISPLTWLLFIVISGKLIFSFPKQGRKVRYLLFFSAVPLSTFFIMSFRQKINANWPAVFYPAGIILLAAWGCGALNIKKGCDKWRRLFLPGIIVGIVFVFLTYGLTFYLAPSSFGGSRLDPTIRLKGWRKLGQEIGTLCRTLSERNELFLLTINRQYASELAFYVPSHPLVYLWPSCTGEIRNQYDLWPGPHDKIGWSGLIVLEDDQTPPPEMTTAFHSVEFLKKITIPLGRGGERQYSLYLGHALKGWPLHTLTAQFLLSLHHEA